MGRDVPSGGGRERAHTHTHTHTHVWDCRHRQRERGPTDSPSTHPTPPPPNHPTTQPPQFYGKGDEAGKAISADAIREMSGGVPDGVIKGLWAAVRSQAFDNLKVRMDGCACVMCVLRGMCVWRLIKQQQESHRMT
jgi:hypothetical protein